MPVRVGVVVFPGSNCDRDTLHGLEIAGAEPVVRGTSRRRSTGSRR